MKIFTEQLPQSNIARESEAKPNLPEEAAMDTTTQNIDWQIRNLTQEVGVSHLLMLNLELRPTEYRGHAMLQAYNQEGYNQIGNGFPGTPQMGRDWGRSTRTVLRVFDRLRELKLIQTYPRRGALHQPFGVQIAPLPKVIREFADSRIEIQDGSKAGYTNIPFYILFDPRLDDISIRIYHDIVRYSLGQGEAFPSQIRIAEDLGINVEIVRRSTIELDYYGWLRCYRRGLHMTNLYVLPTADMLRPQITTLANLINSQPNWGAVRTQNQLAIEHRELEKNNAPQKRPATNAQLLKATAVGNHDMTTAGNQDVTTKGNQGVTTAGNQDLTSVGNQGVTAAGNQDMTTVGNQEVTLSGNQESAPPAAGNQEVTAAGNQEVTPAGNVVRFAFDRFDSRIKRDDKKGETSAIANQDTPKETSAVSAGEAAHHLLEQLIFEFGDAAPDSSHTRLDNIYDNHKENITMTHLLTIMQKAATAARGGKIEKRIAYFFSAVDRKINDHLNSQSDKSARPRRATVRAYQPPPRMQILAPEADIPVAETEPEIREIPSYPLPPSTLIAAWEATCEATKPMLGSSARSWLSGIKVLTLDGDRVVVGAVSSGIHTTCASRYREQLANTLSNYVGDNIEIEFVTSWRQAT